MQKKIRYKCVCLGILMVVAVHHASYSDAQVLSAKEKAEQAEQLRLDGNEDYNAKRFLEAIDKYNKALKLNPENATTYYNLAAAEMDAKQHDSAIRHFKRHLEINQYSTDSAEARWFIQALSRSKDDLIRELQPFMGKWRGHWKVDGYVPREVELEVKMEEDYPMATWNLGVWTRASIGKGGGVAEPAKTEKWTLLLEQKEGITYLTSATPGKLREFFLVNGEIHGQYVKAMTLREGCVLKKVK